MTIHDFPSVGDCSGSLTVDNAALAIVNDGGPSLTVNNSTRLLSIDDGELPLIIYSMSWAQVKYFTSCRLDPVYNIARRYLWPRMAVLLTLAIAGVAVICQ